MSGARRSLACAAVALWLASAASAGERTVVVMLFDGLAPSLVAAAPTPNLDRMAREGASSQALVPAFPSVSLINGVTISTGCWPERHGIVSNRFLDPEKGFYDHSRDADWLTGCEHLHEAAERQGVRSAALDWYGARSGTRGDLATVAVAHEHFEDHPHDDARAAEVVALLERPEAERPRLLLAYLRGPDSAAHFTGMDSDETRAAVRSTDAAVGAVLSAIERHPQREAIDLLVTTDHGMVPVTHIVNVTRILGRHDIAARSVSDGTTSFLYFDDPAGIEPAREALSGYDAFEVYRKAELPAWSHLGTGPRVGDLVLSAHPPYFTADIDVWPAFLRWLGTVGPDFLPALGNLYATHGYPPDTPGVAGVLYAWGAGIAAGREVERVRAVDVHATVAALLGIEPGQPQDGTAVTELLR